MPCEKGIILGVARADLVDLSQIYKRNREVDVIFHIEIYHLDSLNVGGQNLKYRHEAGRYYLYGAAT